MLNTFRKLPLAVKILIIVLSVILPITIELTYRQMVGFRISSWLSDMLRLTGALFIAYWIVVGAGLWLYQHSIKGK